MKCVGWQGNPAFDQRVFAEIHTATGGIPRRINQIVNRLLMLGAVDQRTRIDGVMLQQVLAEYSDDGSISLVRPAPQPVAEPAPAPVLQQVTPAFVPAQPSVDLQAVEQALAERDAQIAELQQAVIELANVAEAPPLHGDTELAATVAALSEQISALENRLTEQDSTIRHTLTMLIEWIEADDAQRFAA
jgi:general secretion pathway protein A